MHRRQMEHIIFSELARFASEHSGRVEIPMLLSLAESLANRLNPQAESDTFLTRKQCAALLGVSLTTLDRYVKEEALPCLPKNPNSRRKHLLFSRQRVLEWAQSYFSGTSKRRPPK